MALGLEPSGVGLLVAPPPSASRLGALEAVFPFSVEPRGLDCMYRVVQPPPKWCDLSLLRNALGLSHVPPSAFPWAEVSCESLVELSLQSLISVQLVESDLHWPPVPQKGGLDRKSVV